MLFNERHRRFLDHRPNARHVQEIGRAKGQDERQQPLVFATWNNNRRGDHRFHYLVQRGARRPRLGGPDAEVLLHRLGRDVHSRFKGAELAQMGAARYAAGSPGNAPGGAGHSLRPGNRQLPVDHLGIHYGRRYRRGNGIAHSHDRRSATNCAFALAWRSGGLPSGYRRIYPVHGHQPRQIDRAGF